LQPVVRHLSIPSRKNRHSSLEIVCSLTPADFAERLRDGRGLFASALRESRREPTRMYLRLDPGAALEELRSRWDPSSARTHRRALPTPGGWRPLHEWARARMTSGRQLLTPARRTGRRASAATTGRLGRRFTTGRLCDGRASGACFDDRNSRALGSTRQHTSDRSRTGIR
jgi:hypothetical protein